MQSTPSATVIVPNGSPNNNAVQIGFHDGVTVSLLDVPLSACRHSRFNTRKTRNDEEIQRLAERIGRNGFERTRALWAVQAEDGAYEVFAGGTRLEAARRVALETVPIMLHAGLSDEDIARRADEDNENDEYHTAVSPVDVWAEYARLRDEEGWTQERIAGAKGVQQSRVSERLKWYGLSDAVKEVIQQGALDEGHLREITTLSIVGYLSGWLTTKHAWEEMAAKAVHDKGKNGEKSVRAVRDDVAVWKEFIAYAESVYTSLPATITLHDLSGDIPHPFDYAPQQEFIAALARRKARSLVQVKAAEQDVRRTIADSLANYQRYVELQSTQAAREAQAADRDRLLMDKFTKGDSRLLLQQWSLAPIRLLLTDPPYGMDYQSNRRWKSKAPDKVIGDGSQDAMKLLFDVLELAVPHLADEAHVLVFCDWEREPEVRAILDMVGLKLKGSLIWVKEEHSAGDVRGSFAPRHERIIHAVKGSPEVTPRIPDVLEVARSRETNHPTEKPVALLQRLIESTTHEGDLVADPFAGCASTLVAASRANRDFWGAELDHRHHDEGTARLLKEATQHGR